jgi:RNA polymerase sigma factor (sigma-70 family)
VNTVNNSSYSDISEEALIAAFVANNNRHRVFMEIVHRYKEKVYYHIRRIVVDHDDADDASQNTFIRVWENLAGFRNECALYSWIYRIATNEALTLLRKKRNHLGLDEANAEMGRLIDSGAYLSGDEIQRKLQKHLLTLPEKQKLVFQLKYFEDLTYEQMAEVTGTSVGALKASYFHAVRKIEQLMNREI